MIATTASSSERRPSRKASASGGAATTPAPAPPEAGGLVTSSRVNRVTRTISLWSRRRAKTRTPIGGPERSLVRIGSDANSHGSVPARTTPVFTLSRRSCWSRRLAGPKQPRSAGGSGISAIRPGSSTQECTSSSFASNIKIASTRSPSSVIALTLVATKAGSRSCTKRQLSSQYAQSVAFSASPSIDACSAARTRATSSRTTSSSMRPKPRSRISEQRMLSPKTSPTSATQRLSVACRRSVTGSRSSRQRFDGEEAVAQAEAPAREQLERGLRVRVPEVPEAVVRDAEHRGVGRRLELHPRAAARVDRERAADLARADGAGGGRTAVARGLDALEHPVAHDDERVGRRRLLERLARLELAVVGDGREQQLLEVAHVGEEVDRAEEALHHPQPLVDERAHAREVGAREVEEAHAREHASARRLRLAAPHHFRVQADRLVSLLELEREADGLADRERLHRPDAGASGGEVPELAERALGAVLVEDADVAAQADSLRTAPTQRGEQAVVQPGRSRWFRVSPA